MTLTVGCLFSGIAGLELGFEQAGFEVVFQVEKDPACLARLAKHWPDVKQYDDVKDVTVERLRADLGPRADVDVLIGGWPCQDISLAGRRAGLAGERSGLFFEFARLVEEIAPRWVVAENVPGLLSSYSPVEPPPDNLEEGREWTVDETNDLGVVIATLTELGYGLAWRVLDAQYFGVPQRRRRVFFVGHLGEPWSAPAEVLFERDSRTGDSAESDEAEPDDACDLGDGVEGDFDEGPRVVGVGATSSADVAGTLGSITGGPRTTDLDIEDPVVIGSEWESEVARPLLAVPHGSRFDLESENLVIEPRAVSLRGREEGNVAELEPDDVSPALRTGQGGSGNPMVIAPDPVSFRKSRRAHTDDDFETWEEDDTTNTITVADFEGGSARATQAIVQVMPEWGEGSDLHMKEIDVAPTLLATEEKSGDRGVRIVHPLDLRQATRTDTRTGVGTPGNGWGDVNDPSYTVTELPPAVVDMVVRRLTPLECTRLQGFPDDWLVSDADAEEAHARQVLRSLWDAARTEAREGRGSGITASLLTPEVLLEGVYVGRLSWQVAAGCVAARGSVPGAEPWPEGFVRAVRERAQRGSASQRRQSAEQLLAELGGSLSLLSSPGALSKASLQRAGMWEAAQAQWPVRHARPAGQGDSKTCGCRSVIPDSVAYRMLGNAVAVVCSAWIAPRLKAVHEAVHG